MEEGKEHIEVAGSVEREEIFSKAVRAGKRTYFFDVKATKRNDYYLTITESKKRFNKDGRFFYEKHKVFLYKEDFEKFIVGLHESVEFIKSSLPDVQADAEEEIQSAPKSEAISNTDEEVKNYTDVEFEDLEVEVTSEESTND